MKKQEKDKLMQGDINPVDDEVTRSVDGDRSFYFRNSRFLVPLIICLMIVSILMIFLS